MKKALLGAAALLLLVGAGCWSSDGTDNVDIFVPPVTPPATNTPDTEGSATTTMP